MFKYFNIILAVLFISCSPKSNVLTELFSLPKDLKEASAIQIVSGSNLMWTLEDAGNEPKVYGIDESGNVEQTITITNAKNNDWEDLADDQEGNLYIGDFGNNDNDRKDLAIYKLDKISLKKDSAEISQKISFYYPEQKDFPTKKPGRIFDVESFFLYDGNFYLFTKNRSTQMSGETSLYQVPNVAGNHAAKLLGKFKTCDNFNHCAIASADISPDGKTVVLLSSTYIWMLTDFTGTNFFSGKSEQIDLKSYTQKEGICFKSNDKLLISDEQKKKTGGKVYELDLANLKSKS